MKLSLHTDVTEYKLTNDKKVYISPVVDEASLEILACTVSYSRVKIESLEEMKEILKDYIYWFNNVRRLNKLKYTTPVKYRNLVLSNL